MIVYSGPFAKLVTDWAEHGALGKFARGLWDNQVQPGRGWSYSGYLTTLRDGMVPYGGKVTIDGDVAVSWNISIRFDDPSDYTLFCLKVG